MIEPIFDLYEEYEYYKKFGEEPFYKTRGTTEEQYRKDLLYCIKNNKTMMELVPEDDKY